MKTTYIRWVAKWRSKNKLDGAREHFLRPKEFETKAKCREWIEDTFGYIRTRPDLRREPHGWRMPVAVHVKITVEEVK